MGNDLTPPAQTDSAQAPGTEPVEGLSQESLNLLGVDPSVQPAPQEQSGELGDEYKPYSQFPWADMNPQTRKETLSRLKKFHGDMSRGSQEAAELRKTNAELQGKADWLDNLANQSWFQQAYQTQMSGQTPSPAGAPDDPPSFAQLNEYGIDAEAAKTMDKAVDLKLRERLGPLAQKLEFLERSLVQDQTNATLQNLNAWAQERGYPTAEAKMPQIREVIRQGRANNVRDAYMLSIGDDVPGVVAQKTRAELQAELKQKAEQSIPPGRSAAGAPSQDFSGDDGVQRAFAEAKSELQGLQGGI